MHGCDHSHFLAQLAAKDAEIKRLKKFDVKFCAEYDADLKPVGRTCDLLEWQAKLQSELKIEQLHHKNTKAELAALRAQSAESEGARIEREFLRSHGGVRDPGAMMSAILGHPCAGPEKPPRKRTDITKKDPRRELYYESNWR